MPKETLTPLERWTAVLRRETPDRVPMDYWGTPEMTEKLMRHLGVNDFRGVMQRLRLDQVLGIAPRYAGPTLPPHTDAYGCRYQTINYGPGAYDECIGHPLAQYKTVQDIEANYTWPTADWYDFSHLPEDIRGWEEYPIRGGGSEPFWTYKFLRGDEQAFLDLLMNPEIVHYCLDKIHALNYEVMRRIFETLPGKVLLTYVAEDMGSQEGLMFSLDQIREFLLPNMRKMINLAHEAGVYVFHHNDGGVREVLPDLIDAGIDILNPIQWRCEGMERAALNRDFGDKLIFHGGMDNQQTLPFGSVEDVRQEVFDNIAILGAGGGYILAPCHNIQSVTPPENVVAMYDAVING